MIDVSCLCWEIFTEKDLIYTLVYTIYSRCHSEVWSFSLALQHVQFGPVLTMHFKMFINRILMFFFKTLCCLRSCVELIWHSSDALAFQVQIWYRQIRKEKRFSLKPFMASCCFLKKLIHLQAFWIGFIKRIRK